MSDNILSVIPTDPHWQPSPESAERATAIAQQLSFVTVEIDMRWYDNVSLVEAGANLERIGCPVCGASIDVEWWADLMQERFVEGFNDLSATVPCCGASMPLNNRRSASRSRSPGT